MKKKTCWFCGIWSGRSRMGFRWKELHWIVAMIPVLFIVAKNYWVSLDIFLPFNFPILRKNTAFTIFPKKMRFVVRKVPSLFTNG